MNRVLLLVWNGAGFRHRVFRHPFPWHSTKPHIQGTSCRPLCWVWGSVERWRRHKVAIDINHLGQHDFHWMSGYYRSVYKFWRRGRPMVSLSVHHLIVTTFLLVWADQCIFGWSGCLSFFKLLSAELHLLFESLGFKKMALFLITNCMIRISGNSMSFAMERINMDL